jgi:hypothetical protein
MFVRLSFSFLGVMWLLASAAEAQLLFNETFDVDPTANWTFNSSIAGDTANNNSGGEANFFFDYSTVGIPAAPNSIGGTTRGLKLEANVPGTAVFSGISVSPNGQSFSGDYVLRFDAWQNINGPFPAGGSGSTQMTDAGVGTNGTTAQFPGGTLQSAMFAASGDGGTATDYRAYTAPGAPATDTSGVYAAGAVTGSTNNTNSYYSNFGNASAPAAQVALFPQQTGTTAAGTQGMAWHVWEITKSGNFVTWEIDDKPIATLDISTANLAGSNIFLGQFDINATSSADVNARSLLFGLVDNVRVTAIPEPGTGLLLLFSAFPLTLRRRR